MTAAVSLRGVSVRYHEDWIGAGIDLEVRPGEVLLVLGPSGCGKSTLMLTLPGLIPDSLEADLRGTVVRPAGACRCAMVFQDPDAQVVTGTLLDEVCFGLENLLVPAPDVEPRALAALRRVGLAGCRSDAARSPQSLSGGGRQRLALACALALDPDVLVLDEPTANLDPVASAELYDTLAGLRDGRRAIVLVEHELDDALPLADRVVVLDGRGSVVHDGSPAEVIGRHARELRDLGVWLPTAAELALRLGLDRDGSVPLTVDALVGRVGAAPTPPGGWLDTAPMPGTQPEARAQRGAEPRSGPAPGSQAEARAQRVAGRRPDPTPGGRADAAAGPTGADCEVRGAASPAVEVSGLRVVLGGRIVLDGVDLTVPCGELLAVVGVNGAGKTTLTRAIAGLVPLTAGSVDLHGTSLADLDARAVGDLVGYVFQNPEHQFVTATVADELAHGLRVRRREPDQVARAVEAMLERFDLARYRATNPFCLSHGEKRRLSVATALITSPRVLVLDEPTFGQDRARAGEIVELVGELNATGVTVLLVTHDLQLVAETADRVALLAGGRLLAVGTARDVLCHDETIAAAGLRPPPVHRAARALAARDPGWSGVYRTVQVAQVSR